jgi:hypothetical protein
VFGSWQEIQDGEPYLQSLANEASQWLGGVNASSILAEFPQVSSTLSTDDCVPYEIELTDPTPVRSTLYRYAPPKLSMFRSMVEDVLEKGVVRPSKPPMPARHFWCQRKAGAFD